MSPEAKAQPGRFEKLTKVLEDAPRDYAFLAEYVRQRELHRQEEDIFHRLAFESACAGEAYGKGGPFIVSVVSELYEPLDADHKLEIRRWWHEKMLHEANQFDDLGARLSKLT